MCAKRLLLPRASPSTFSRILLFFLSSFLFLLPLFFDLPRVNWIGRSACEMESMQLQTVGLRLLVWGWVEFFNSYMIYQHPQHEQMVVMIYLMLLELKFFLVRLSFSMTFSWVLLAEVLSLLLVVGLLEKVMSVDRVLKAIELVDVERIF